MKPVDFRIGCGVCALIYFNILAIVQKITGFDIYNMDNLVIVIAIGLPIAITIAYKLNKNYDSNDETDDVIFYLLAFFLGILFIVLALGSKNG